jgi:hypothetical protein
VSGFADHSAVEYLAHPATVEGVWRPIVERRLDARALHSVAQRKDEGPPG